MPNRILKESICTSATIDALSPENENFFYRLIVQCDDYGRLDARPEVLRSKCFPLRIDQISNDQIIASLETLVQQGLVQLYEVDAHPYLRLASWDAHQQIRAKRSKHPEPPLETESLTPPINSVTPPNGPEHSQVSDSNGNQVITHVPVIQSNPNPIRIQSNLTKNKAPPETAKTPRELTPIQKMYGAFMNAFGYKPDSKSKEEGKWLGAAKELVKRNVSAEEIPRLFQSYSERWPGVDCTPNAIANNVSLLRTPIPSKDSSGAKRRDNNNTPAALTLPRQMFCPLCSIEIRKGRTFDGQHQACEESDRFLQWETEAFPVLDERWAVTAAELEAIKVKGDAFQWLATRKSS